MLPFPAPGPFARCWWDFAFLLQANSSTPFSDPYSWACLMARHSTWIVWTPCLAGLLPKYEMMPFINLKLFNVSSCRCFGYWFVICWIWCFFFSDLSRDLAVLTMSLYLGTERHSTSFKSDPTASTNSLSNEAHRHQIILHDYIPWWSISLILLWCI